MKKNNTINPPEIRVTFHALTPPVFCLIEMSIGIEPTTSITANRVNVRVRNSWSSNCMVPFLQKYASVHNFIVPLTDPKIKICTRSEIESF